MSTDPTRQAELAKIHIARKDLKLSDVDYEAMVSRASGGSASSAKDLDSAGRGRLLGALRKMGWKPKAKAGGRIAGDTSSRMIRGLWIELAKAGRLRDGSEAALRKWVENETGRSDLTFCSTTEKAKLIQALKSWTARPQAAP